MKKLQEMSNQELYTYAKTRIPGGTQLLSKRPEQFAPNQWPNYATRGEGCQVWDVEGNHYYDMTTNGVGACLLGYADPDVTRVVVDRIQKGSMTTLNSPEEVYLAERLCQIHPWAQNVRFARTGGETCAVAVRIARATTGRNLVALCGYHGWSDWYIAANLGEDDKLNGQLLPGLEPAGVPQQLSGTALTFFYNDKEGFDALMAQYGDQIACVIMEPIRGGVPQGDFLQHVRVSTKRAGALLIFDEITVGWRYHFGGSHLKLGVTPDMATFVFDNPGIGECSIITDPELGQSQMYTRAVMCHGLLETGLPYVGLTVFQRMRFMEHLRTLSYVDQKNIAISSHSLGTEAAIFMGLLCDDIKGIVFNEDLHDDRRRFMCITEHPGPRMFQNYGNWHIVPGQFRSFGYQDMCAAFAPRYLGMTEGGADEFMHTIERAYKFCNAEDHLVISYYTDYQDPETRKMDVPVPAYGLSSADFYRKYMYVTVSDHSFRKDPALKLLKKCFGME